MLRCEADYVEDRWALSQTECTFLANKSGVTRLGFAVLLKMFQAEGRFPRHVEDVPVAAVEAVARQVEVPAVEWQRYDWSGRAIAYHRAQIRSSLGFREATLEDAEALSGWLESQVFAHDRRTDRLTMAARERCRILRIEPPLPDRLKRLVRSAIRRHDAAFGAALLARLPAETVAALAVLDPRQELPLGRTIAAQGVVRLARARLMWGLCGKLGDDGLRKAAYRGG